jgi:tetratricopeptide (TPR) repeat protein
MKKQTAVIIISLFILIVAGLCTYLFYYYVGGSKALDNATFAFDNGNIDKSIQLLEEKDSKSIDEQLLLAISYAQKGTIDFDESENATKALDIVNKVLLIDSNNAEAYRVRGYAYEIQKQYDLAIEAYDKAIILDPQFALAYSSRGHTYDLKGDSEKAIVDYKTALDIDGSLDHAELNIARVYFRNGDIDQATQYLNRVVEESSNLSFKAAAEQILGVIDLSKGNNSGAKRHFDIAIAYDDMLTAAYVGRGEANFSIFFEELKKNPELQAEPVYDIVFADVSKALEINKNQVSALMLAYKLLIVSGDKESAKQMLTMAEASVPNDITLGQLEKSAYLTYITSLKNSSN